MSGLYSKLIKSTKELIGTFSALVHNLWAVLLPVSYAKYYYKKVTSRELNLQNPRDYNEKVQWLKIYSDTSLWTMLADKYKVRKYVKDCGLDDILVELYGVWRKAEEIDFSLLPNSFVLKTNNGCGKNLLVYNKGQINEKEIRDLLKFWLKDRNSLVSFQPHMWNIESRIIAEELLSNKSSVSFSKSLIDYKFFCFHGEPEFIDVIYDRNNLTFGEKSVVKGYLKRENVYDLNWRPMPEILAKPTEYDMSVDLPKPSCLEGMINICKILSKPFPQVRVDLYEVNNKVYFGEMTFTPGGMNDFTPSFLVQMGDKIDLSKVKLRDKHFII